MCHVILPKTSHNCACMIAVMVSNKLHCTVLFEKFCSLNKRFCRTHTTSKLHRHVMYLMSRVHTQVQHLGSSQQHGWMFLKHSTCSSQIISQLWVLQFLLSLGSLIHQLRGIAAKCLYVIKQFWLTGGILQFFKVIFNLRTKVKICWLLL